MIQDGHTRHGIETVYRSMRFRSRVEARWAAFFDILRWPWRYEPLDLNGYIPDFSLQFKTPLLVEVKSEIDPNNLRQYQDRLSCVDWPGEILLVGATPFPGGVLGHLAERGGSESHWFADAELFRCLLCNEPSFLHSDGSWHCRRTGCYDGNGHIGSFEDAEIQDLWASASNAVRWTGFSV